MLVCRRMGDMKVKYWTGAHTKHRLLYHLVWIPKYRKRILRGKLVARLRGLFKQAGEVNGWSVEELNVMDDHVHMFIQTKPSDAVSKVVQILKGGSSRVVRLEFPELEEFLWGDSFWADGYFAESCGKLNEEAIREYIKNQ